MSLQEQIDSEGMSGQGFGSQRSHVVLLEENGQPSTDQSSSRSRHVVTSTASSEQASCRLENGSRSDRGSISSDALDVQRSSPLERSILPPSSFRERIFWDEPSSTPIGVQEHQRSPHLEHIVLSPSYRSRHRTSWVEQSNLSLECVEQKTTFSYEHTATSPGSRPFQPVSTTSEHQENHQFEIMSTNSHLAPEQRVTSGSDNLPLIPECQRTAYQPEHLARSSIVKCECRCPQADEIAANVSISPEQQTMQPAQTVRSTQQVKHIVDVSIATLSKPKLNRLNSEPCAFSTIISESSIPGLQIMGSGRRRDELKRSLSFDVTSPSYYEAFWTGLQFPSQLVVTRPQLSRSMLNRKHLSLHLEGVFGDMNSLRADSPLQFHDTHGDNMELQNNKTRARRYESFCKGICFSNRPIAINEKVYIKFVETNTSWSGVMRFGFTSINPATLRGCDLPRYACPDLTNKQGNWAKALGERYTASNILLHFSVNRGGDVTYGVNGEEKGLFFSGVVTSQPLWALFDVYGNTVTVEFSHANAEIEPPASASQFDMSPQSVDCNHFQLSSLSLNGAPSSPAVTPFAPLIFWHAHITLVPLQFHPLMGRNVSLVTDGTIAARVKHEYCNAVVFTARPIRCGETLVIQVLGIDRSVISGLGFGLTSCDPANLVSSSLPDDSDLLLDRQEYWVINKDICRNSEVGDELSFCISDDGEVRYTRNNQVPVTLMHVDRTLPLWAFFDVYGNIKKIKLVGTTMTPCQGHLPWSPTMSSYSNNSLGDGVSSSGSVGTAHGSSVLTLDMPPLGHMRPGSMGTNISRSSSSLPTSCVSSSGEYACETSTTYPAASPLATPVSQSSHIPFEEEAADCKVCWERVINCVLYTCGHMCVCFDCAMKIRNEKGLCPICRQSIYDVIKFYKS